MRSRLKQFWSPEQIAGGLPLDGLLWIRYETIYRYIWHDQRRGNSLYLFLRGSRKHTWTRYRSYDSRGRMRGKRPISDRSAGAQNRSRVGHHEGGTVNGAFDRHCTLARAVGRKTGCLMIGKLFGRTTVAAIRRADSVTRNAPRRPLTSTVDNGTEFHGFRAVEKATGATIYFATRHSAPLD